MRHQVIYMEILFIVSCMAVVFVIPFLTAWVRTRRTATIISRLYFVIAYLLVMVSIFLFIAPGKTSYSFYEVCAMCDGSGAEAGGTQCSICCGTGEILSTLISYSVARMYPICLIVLGVYIGIFSFALKVLSKRLEPICFSANK